MGDKLASRLGNCMTFNVLELFNRGGGFMWPLLILSVLSLFIIVERLIFFSRHRYRVSPSLEEIRAFQAHAMTVEEENNPLVSCRADLHSRH